MINIYMINILIVNIVFHTISYHIILIITYNSYDILIFIVKTVTINL